MRREPALATALPGRPGLARAAVCNDRSTHCRSGGCALSATLDTERFRKRLLEERQRAQEALDYLHQENQGLIQDETQEIQSDNHPGDVATATFDRELDSTLEENEERLIGAMDAALRRIDDGSYGMCGSCGQPIAEERLEALPWTTRCIDCKRREERG